MTLRSDLATAIQAAVPGVQVYDHLADVVALPAVVIQRTSTYPKTTGGPYNLEHDITLHIIVSRAMPSESETLLEDTFMDIAEALPGTAYRWTEFGGAEPLTINNQDALSGALTIKAKE